MDGKEECTDLNSVSAITQKSRSIFLGGGGEKRPKLLKNMHADFLRLDSGFSAAVMAML